MNGMVRGEGGGITGSAVLGEGGGVGDGGSTLVSSARGGGMKGPRAGSAVLGEGGGVSRVEEVPW